MRRSKNNDYIKKCSVMGKKSAESRAKERLENALNYRPINSMVVFDIWTNNPRSGAKHHLEIKHEIDNGNDRYNVYLDGERWKKPFSRWGFCRWLFCKIDSVIIC